MFKKYLVSILVILCLLIPAACAEEIGVVSDADRVSLAYLNGLSASMEWQGDEWKLIIDPDQTDWISVMDDPNMRISGDGLIMLPILVYPSDPQTAYYSGYGSSEASDAEIISGFSREQQHQGTYFDYYLEIGRYNETTGSFSAATRENHLICVRWFDANRQLLATEKVPFSYTTGKVVSPIELGDYDRVELVPPEGMSASFEIVDDYMLISVDEENCDWEKVYKNADITDANYVLLPVRINAPEGAVKFSCVNTSENDDAFIYEELEKYGVNTGTYHQCGWEVGKLYRDEDENSYTYEPHELSQQVMCVRWYDADGNEVCTEKILFGTIMPSEDWGDEEVELPYVDPENNYVSVLGLEDYGADRVKAWIPEGMVANFYFNRLNGYWELNIDNHKTDWNEVLKHAYDAENNVVTIRFGFDGPRGAAYKRDFGTSELDDKKLLEMFNQELFGRAGNETSNGEHIGSYVPGVNMFQPTVYENQMMVQAAQWFDKDKNLISTEKLVFTISFNNQDATQATLNQVPAVQMVASPNLTEEEQELVTTTVSNGTMRYDVQPSQEMEFIHLDTWLLCPAYIDDDDTNDDVQKEDWRCVNSEAGESWEVELDWISVNGGEYLAAEAFARGVELAADAAETAFGNFIWYYKDEEVFNGSMQQIIQVGEPKAWPEYVDYWTPVSEDQIAGIKTVNAVEGLTATYNKGTLHIGVEDDKLPSGKDLSLTSFEVSVTPPAGAVYYKENHSGGNNIFGFDEWMLEDQENIMQYQEFRSVKNQPFSLDIFPCRKFTTKISDDLTLSIYLSRDITPVYGGGISLIYWYDQNRQLISRQWIVDRYDTISRVEESAAYEEETDITEVLEIPAIVVFEKGGRHKYTLRVTSLPQEGSDYIYYDLSLVDKHGNIVELSEIDKHDNKRCKIYIPYPDGLGKNSRVKYNIHHLNSKHHAKEYFSEDSEAFKVYRTEYGLCIEVNSLSPFVLSWEEVGELPAVEMDLPDSLTAIKAEAFMGDSFSVARIADSCVSIGSRAFADVVKLQVYMPVNETLEIAADAFDKDVTMFVVEGTAAHAFAEANGYFYYTINP